MPKLPALTSSEPLRQPAAGRKRWGVGGDIVGGGWGAAGGDLCAFVGVALSLVHDVAADGLAVVGRGPDPIALA